MLVLSRKKNESIVINNDITVTVVEIRGDKVRLGIVAPKDFPVHPAAQTIEGVPVFHSILEVPAEKVDRVSLYLPPQIGLQVIEEIAQKAVGEVWLNPGAESPALIARGQELGLNMIVGCSIVDIGVDPGD